MRGRVVAVNVSSEKGMRKRPAGKGSVKKNYGIEGDAHASSGWHRQVSLLAIESIRKMRELGLDVNPGDFAENITTEGIILHKLPLGTIISIGEVELEISQIGKECHSRCNIYYQAGDCIMPKEGIFAKVLKGGIIREGDEIRVSD